MGTWESTLSTSIQWHLVRYTGRNGSYVNGGAPHPRAPTSSPRAALRGTAHGSLGEHPHPRAPTSSLRTAQAGIALGSMGEHPSQVHPRSSCALHRQESLEGRWESTASTSIREHPVRCTRRNRSWVHGRAPRPRAFASILRAEQVGTAHGPMGDHPIHEHP